MRKKLRVSNATIWWILPSSWQAMLSHRKRAAGRWCTARPRSASVHGARPCSHFEGAFQCPCSSSLRHSSAGPCVRGCITGVQSYLAGLTSSLTSRCSMLCPGPPTNLPRALAGSLPFLLHVSVLCRCPVSPSLLPYTPTFQSSHLAFSPPFQGPI